MKLNLKIIILVHVLSAAILGGCVGNLARTPHTSSGVSATHTRHLSGRVLGPDGRAVENAMILTACNFVEPVRKAVTGADGLFNIIIPDHWFDMNTEVSAPGLSRRSYMNIPVEVDDVVMGDIALSKAPRVEGVVLDPNGDPVANCNIHAWPAWSVGGRLSINPDVGTIITKTDSKGKFVADSLSPDEWFVGAENDTFGDRVVRLDLAPGDEENIILALPRAEKIRGTVVNDRGEPVAGASVRTPFANDAPPWRSTAITDPQGEFSLFPPAQEHFNVRAVKGARASAFLSWKEFNLTKKLVIPMVPGWSSIRVQIPESEMPEGARILYTELLTWDHNRLNVYFSPHGGPSEQDFAASAVTLGFSELAPAPRRLVEVPLNINDFIVRVHLTDGSVFDTDFMKSPPPPSSEPVEVAAHRTQQKLFVALIVDSAGRAVPGMLVQGEVELQEGEWQSIPPRFTDSEGRFEAVVAQPGKLIIYGAGKSGVIADTRLVHDPDLNNPPPRIVATPGARLRGIVTINGSRPARPVFVQIEKYETRNNAWWTAWDRAGFVSTDSNGAFESGALRPGRYRVTARHEPGDSDGFEENYKSETKELRIGNSGDSELTLNIIKNPTARVHITITAGGLPSEFCVVDVVDESGRTPGFIKKADGLGKCYLKFSDGGTFTFTAKWRDATLQKKVAIAPGEVARVRLEF